MAVVSQSARRGWVAGPLISTGHALLELALVVLIAFGLSTGLARPAVQTLIALLGGGLLIWMGAGMALAALRGNVHLPGKEKGSAIMTGWQILGLGMVTTISNPFWYAWWVTVAAGYLAQAQTLGAASIAAFYLGHISADYGWNTALAALVGGGRRWFTDRHYRGIIFVCGAFLIYLGLVFLLRGLSF